MISFRLNVFGILVIYITEKLRKYGKIIKICVLTIVLTNISFHAFEGVTYKSFKNILQAKHKRLILRKFPLKIFL